MGVSFNDPGTNDDWAEQEGMQFELWPDDSHELGVHYGAASGPTDNSMSRISYLLDADGVVALEYTSVSASAHPSEVLEDCEALFGP